MTYVKFPPGAAFPGGYVAPCEVVKTIPEHSVEPFGAYVKLSNAEGTAEWEQYVSIKQLLTDEEVEKDG
jgi:hypothetical protein